MNTISELNTWGQTSVTYTDDRNPAVIFDRAAGLPQTAGTATGQSFQGPIGIDIVEIIKPDDLNIYYEVNVTSVPGASVSWPSVPDGVTVTNPSVGVYRVNNIDTLVQWQAVRYPTINLPAGWEDNFEYISSIKYDPNQVKSWVTSVNVGIAAILNTTVSCSATLSGIQRSFVTTGSTSTMTTLGGFPNFGQASFTITSQIACESKVIQFGSAFVGGGVTFSLIPRRRRPLVSSMSSLASQTTTGITRLRPGSASGSAITQASNIGGLGFSAQQYFSVPQVPALYPNYYAFGANPTGRVFTTSGFGRNTGYVQIYYYTGGAWTQPTRLQPDQSYIDSIAFDVARYFYFGYAIAKNSSENWVAVLAPEFYYGNSELYTFERIGTDWYRRDRILLKATYNVYAQGGLLMNTDGSYMAIVSNRVLIWNRSGSSFGLQQNLETPSISGYTMTNMFMDSGGTKILCHFHNENNGSAVIVISRSGSTWTTGSPTYFTLPALHTQTPNSHYCYNVSSDLNYMLIQSASGYHLVNRTTTPTHIQTWYWSNVFGTFRDPVIQSTSPLTLRALSQGTSSLGSTYSYLDLTQI